jgi:hypothetical protein
MRGLRNRVFHHEPVWRQPDLATQFNETLEMVGWMNRAARALCGLQDRFSSVHAQGWLPYRRLLNDMIANRTLEQMIDDEAACASDPSP